MPAKKPEGLTKIDLDGDAQKKSDRDLLEHIGSFAYDPLGFVLQCFPWGTGELSPTPSDPNPGPDGWQSRILIELGEALRKDMNSEGIYIGQAIQFAVASGHGIGKSALLCWIILWAMATRRDTRGVVTANTMPQLMTKTWPELAKWHRLFIGSKFFKVEKTSMHSLESGHEMSWRMDAIPWSKANPQAFAGLHNQGKRALMIFDEASDIDDIVWETAEGFTTDANTENIWMAFGNPTRNVGRFRECFRKFRSTWRTRKVDSRTSKQTNKVVLNKRVEDWGENSDYIKVRVRGEFPAQSDLQFISQDLVDAANGKHLDKSLYHFAPVVIGVDPAWTGGDETVIWLRQGLYSEKLMTMPRNDDDNVVAGFIAKFEDERRADAVFIDFGFGTGIASAGKLMGRSWTLVPFGGAPADPQYLNKRAEIWGLMRDWLRGGGALPPDQQICEELISPEYSMTTPKTQIKLESKEDMKDRGLPSPNRADALALTFSMPVKKKNVSGPGRESKPETVSGHDADGRSNYIPKL